MKELEIENNDMSLDEVARSIIFWGHDYRPEESFSNRYFSQTIGSDFQMSSMQAAFGLAQIEKVERFIVERANQFKEIYSI